MKIVIIIMKIIIIEYKESMMIIIDRRSEVGRLLLDGWMKMEGIMGLRKAPPSLEAHH
jgi:hypothetical protein